MRVGVYIDGFNLYYGARMHCGVGTSGWRWLDLRGLARSVIPTPWRIGPASTERVVYCTARVSGAMDATSPRDQEVYLRALVAHGSVDKIEYGAFVSRSRVAPMACAPGSKSSIYVPDWPVKVGDRHGDPVEGARFLVSYVRREEKGSDVNVGAHLLLDVLESVVDAAIVISNDSDLELPINEARKRVPLGTVNPGTAPTAGKLRGCAEDGVGGHWWRRLDAEAYRANQLPRRVGKLSKPREW